MTVATLQSLTSPHPTATKPLSFLIPGGEGHLGNLLSCHFSALGHSVTTMTRYPERSGSRGPAKPWHTRAWDGHNLGDWIEALEQTDVLINLAGRSVDCRYNAHNRREILQSRVHSTDILGQAMQALARPPRLWLNASTATIYRHAPDRDMDEATGELGGNEPDAPASWRFSIEVAKQWEERLFALRTPKTRKIAMRAAMVMSSQAGGVFDAILRLVRMGFGGKWGAGTQYMSWIHEADFCRAVDFLIERENISGVVNLASPAPMPNDEFLYLVRDAWGIDYGLPAPEWMLAVGAFLLRTETELLLKSRRVVPGVLLNHGFSFLFPEWPRASLDLVRRWKKRYSPESDEKLSHGP
jgi:uncharacterized protein